MRFSKHAGRIELHFAGKGPYMKKYMKLADRLVNDGVLKHHPRFGFYSREELKQLIRQAYLYIHCAWVEVEGLSCVEAIMEGTVPVIAKGELTATSQFALDERSLFTESDPRMLAEKIDWWIEHPAERNRMAAEYAESAQKYNAEDSTDKIIQMYKDALTK
jgi:glycosyltransferase involved in cell wall biosynthesis